MNATQPQSDRWMAGLRERQVAFSVAAIASLAIVALLVFTPTPSDNSRNGDRPAVEQTPSYPIPPKANAIPPKKTHKPAANANANKRPVPPAPKKTVRIPPEKNPNPKATTVRKIVKKTARKAAGAHAKPAKKTVKPVRTAAKQRTRPAINPATRATDAKTAVFFVQVGAYSRKSSAEKQAAALMQQGWNSVVMQNAKGLHVVRIGPVSSLTNAGDLRRKLAAKAHIKGFVVRAP